MCHNVSFILETINWKFLKGKLWSSSSVDWMVAARNLKALHQYSTHSDTNAVDFPSKVLISTLRASSALHFSYSFISCSKLTLLLIHFSKIVMSQTLPADNQCRVSTSSKHWQPGYMRTDSTKTPQVWWTCFILHIPLILLLTSDTVYMLCAIKMSKF